MPQDLATTRGITEVEERSPNLLSRLLAETFGTFLLTLVILGTLVYPMSGAVGLIAALGAAFAYIGGAAAVGRISGAHFNPAISLGAWLGGRISISHMLSYWGVQLVGAMLAGAVLFATVPQLGQQNTSELFHTAVNGYSTHSPLYLQTQGQAQFDWLPALLIEVVISAILVGVYLGVHDSRSKVSNAAFAVGSTIAAMTLISWFVTNTGMNPARSTAAALFANDWGSDGSGRQLWLFWVAPLVGAALAALFYRAFGSAPEELYSALEEDDSTEAIEEEGIVQDSDTESSTPGSKTTPDEAEGQPSGPEDEVQGNKTNDKA